MASDESYIDLIGLQVMLKQGVARLFPDSLWVRAEIASIGVRANGHCYMELSQNDGDITVAKARAAAWKYNWMVISRTFRAATGEDLKVGQEVLVKVRITFHEVYGMTLSIEDINPEFTLGARELQKKQTIARLEKEGLMDMQKELVLPDLPYWLAVISAHDAAGYGDFRHHLLDNAMGYAYGVNLFEATMQGAGAPDSICAALSEIESSKVPYDAVLILRGGGSELDLACFDDYGMAAAIARCPIPVITAIGHDRDHHVADMVANCYVKTPTALADLFISCTAAEDERIGDIETRLRVAFSDRASAGEQMISRLESAISHAVPARFAREEDRLSAMSAAVAKSAVSKLLMAENRMTAIKDSISRSAASRLLREEDKLSAKQEFIRRMAANRIEKAEIKLSSLEMRIAASDPRRVLERGIPVVEDRSGRKDVPAAGYRPGDPVRVWLSDGRLDCVVQKVTLSEPLSQTDVKIA